MGNKNGPTIPKRIPINSEIKLSKGYAHKQNNRKRKRKDNQDSLIEAKIIKKNVGNSTKLNKKKDIFDELAKSKNTDAYIAFLNALIQN
jgi:hypothetical protein